jgi:hypothetical protein
MNPEPFEQIVPDREQAFQQHLDLFRDGNGNYREEVVTQFQSLLAHPGFKLLQEHIDLILATKVEQMLQLHVHNIPDKGVKMQILAGVVFETRNLTHVPQIILRAHQQQKKKEE